MDSNAHCWISSRAATAADPDHHIGLQRLFQEVSAYARDVQAPRGSTKDLRRRIRSALAEGAIPHARIGRCVGVRQGDIPRLAAVLGIEPGEAQTP